MTNVCRSSVNCYCIEIIDSVGGKWFTHRCGGVYDLCSWDVVHVAPGDSSWL